MTQRVYSQTIVHKNRFVYERLTLKNTNCVTIADLVQIIENIPFINFYVPADLFRDDLF